MGSVRVGSRVTSSGLKDLGYRPDDRRFVRCQCRAQSSDYSSTSNERPLTV